MRLLTVMVLLFTFISPVTAEIYKGLDAEGGVTYSDKETPDSKIFPNPSSNTVQMPKAVPGEKVEDGNKAAAYSLFKITTPADNATLRSNLGKLSINLAIEPALDIDQGHTISILLDGRPVINKATQLRLELSDIDRGSHTLKARLRDKQGRSIRTSNSVRFHMKRLSIQHTQPTGTPPGPSQPDGSSYTPGPQGAPFIPGPVTPPVSP